MRRYSSYGWIPSYTPWNSQFPELEKVTTTLQCGSAWTFNRSLTSPRSTLEGESSGKSLFNSGHLLGYQGSILFSHQTDGFWRSPWYEEFADCVPEDEASSGHVSQLRAADPRCQSHQSHQDNWIKGIGGV